MNSPTTPGAYADRHIDCQFALEDCFVAVMEEAQKAGWTPSDAAAAIIDLADNYVLKLLANDETMAQISRALSFRLGG